MFARSAAVLIAAVGLTCVAVLAYAQGKGNNAEVELAIQQQLPRTRDYSFVALPTTPPPGDAASPSGRTHKG